MIEFSQENYQTFQLLKFKGKVCTFYDALSAIEQFPDTWESNKGIVLDYDRLDSVPPWFPSFLMNQVLERLVKSQGIPWVACLEKDPTKAIVIFTKPYLSNFKLGDFVYLIFASK